MAAEAAGTVGVTAQAVGMTAEAAGTVSQFV